MKKDNEEELFVKELLDAVSENEAAPNEDELFENEELEHEDQNLEHGYDEELEHAIFDFAKVLGKSSDEIKKLLKKGEEFDSLSKKFGESKGDTEIFEKLAKLRGISKDEMKNEILWALEKATFEKSIGEIMEANPGMNRETANELANFRLNLKKSEKNPEKQDKNKEMLEELENFLSTHSGERIEKLAQKVVEEWEGGIPLETAFEKNRLFKENERLFSEIEKMKNEKIKESQKNYAREHSPGSANSAAGILSRDEFIEELFKEY